MTPAEQLHAAAQALRDGHRLHEAVADLLAHEAPLTEIRVGIWEVTGQDVEGLTRCHLGRWLAVAQAALAEAG